MISHNTSTNYNTTTPPSPRLRKLKHLNTHYKIFYMDDMMKQKEITVTMITPQRIRKLKSKFDVKALKMGDVEINKSYNSVINLLKDDTVSAKSRIYAAIISNEIDRDELQLFALLIAKEAFDKYGNDDNRVVAAFTIAENYIYGCIDNEKFIVAKKLVLNSIDDVFGDIFDAPTAEGSALVAALFSSWGMVNMNAKTVEFALQTLMESVNADIVQHNKNKIVDDLHDFYKCSDELKNIIYTIYENRVRTLIDLLEGRLG